MYPPAPRCPLRRGRRRDVGAQDNAQTDLFPRDQFRGLPVPQLPTQER
jgi:hypothetical protein